MAQRHEFTEDLYAVLGVSRDASAEEIRRAGRSRQRATHPDYGGDAGEFVRVRIAVEVLEDESMRAEHDAWLVMRERGGRSGAATAAGRTAATAGPRVRRQRRGGGTADAPTREARRDPGPEAPPAPAPRETPPPQRIPTPDSDVRRMAWFRTAWPAEPQLWPPTSAPRPGLSGGELAAAALYAVVLLGATFLLIWPDSPARLTLPDGDPATDGPSGWPMASLYALAGLTWLALRLLVVRPGLSRGLLLALTIFAFATSGIVLVLGIFGLLVSGQGAEPTTGPTLLVQGVLYALTGGSMLIASFALRGRAKAYQRDRLLVQLAEESAPAEDLARRSWGEPAKTVMGGAGMYPGVNPMRAILAQREVGKALEQLERIPGVRIVHGLRVPGRTAGSVPHAIIAGRRIALVDAQLWAPAAYAIDRQGRITADGVPFETAASAFPHAVERYHELFGDGAEVRGWITILAEREGQLAVDNALTWERARLATMSSMLREVGDWLAGDGLRVDRLVLRDLLRQRL
ncbi:Chaperone protein DnaJ [Pseudoclavibacter triregionum]|nr:Chaperone protein DnaJ [Pseudoclavibacter triregionum]